MLFANAKRAMTDSVAWLVRVPPVLEGLAINAARKRSQCPRFRLT